MIQLVPKEKSEDDTHVGTRGALRSVYTQVQSRSSDRPRALHTESPSWVRDLQPLPDLRPGTVLKSDGRRLRINRFN